MSTVKPWLSADGKPLSDSELKIVSKNWTPDEWEHYLQSIEHEESDEVVLLGRPEQIEQNVTEDFRVLLTDPAPIPERLAKEVEAAVNALPPKRRKLIRSSYWGGESERRLAREASVNRSAIYKQKKKAKKQIKNFLSQNSRHLAQWIDKK